MPIKKRAVFYIGGYDPKSPRAFYDRLSREAKRFEQLWDTCVKTNGSAQCNNDVTVQKFTTTGEHENEKWMVETDFHFLTLDDIVLKDFKRPIPMRIGRSVMTTLDYVFSGTAFGFLRHAWRFFLYFSYPPLMLLTTLLFSYAVSSMAVGVVHFLGAVILFFILLGLIIHFVWKRWFVLHLMDLWSFSREVVHQSRSDIENKLENFSNIMVQKAQSQNYDEILFIGHSTGGALILDAAGRAVEKEPDLAKLASSVSVLTVGSTSLKIGMHPSARWFRNRVQNLFKNQLMNWVEYQCHTDVINFYKTDPAQLMKLGLNGDQVSRPIVRQIRIKEMISPDTYQRIRKNLFRVHYQFVFGNTRKYHYDFPAICYGPMSIGERASKPELATASLIPSEPTAN